MRTLQISCSTPNAIAWGRSRRWVPVWVLILGVWGRLCGTAHAQEDGALRWAARVQGYITTSSPAVTADSSTIYIGVFAGSGGRLVAMRSDGIRDRWSANLPGYVDSSPAIGADGTVYVGCGDGKLYALRGSDGAVVWSVPLGPFISSSPAIGADGTIYVGSGDGALHAVSPAGVPRWRFPTGDWVLSSPAIAGDGTIYVGSDDHRLYAITPAGTQKWAFVTGGPVFSSPAIGADGTIYVGSDDQTLYALDRDGNERWSRMTNGEIQSSPVTGADGTIYFASTDTVFYALRPDGQEKWRRGINSTTISSAAVRSDGVVIVGGDDGIVRALEPSTGASRWTFDTNTADNNIESSAIIGPDGTIYVGCLDGSLYSLHGNGSPLSTVASWPAFRRDVSHTARLTTAVAGHLVNLSTRAQAGDTDTLIAGFFVQGTGEKAYLLRGVGPTLAQFGVQAYMPDPRLDLYSGSRLMLSNDNWNEAAPGFSAADTADAVGAFPLPRGSKDASMVPTLPPGLYTAHIGSANGQGGIVLVEAYDARGGESSTRLVNLSMRSKVGRGENIFIMGFVLDGLAPTRLLVRAVGPALAQFGVTDPLARPSMTLYRGLTPVRSNTGWTTDGMAGDLAGAAHLVAAFPFPDGSADSALLLTVQPGLYTVQISGVGESTGEALAEVYVVP